MVDFADMGKARAKAHRINGAINWELVGCNKLEAKQILQMIKLHLVDIEKIFGLKEENQ